MIIPNSTHTAQAAAQRAVALVWVILSRVFSPAFPVVRNDPFLEIDQPEVGPGDDGEVQTLAGVPLPGPGQIETEPIRAVVDMRQVASTGEQPQVRFYDPNVRRPVLSRTRVT